MSGPNTEKNNIQARFTSDFFWGYDSLPFTGPPDPALDPGPFASFANEQHFKGEHCVDITGQQFHCTVDGIPGTWVQSATAVDGLNLNSVLVWNINGNIQPGVEQDGLRSPFGFGVIDRIGMYLGDVGGDGDTIVDIRKHQITGSPLDPGETEFTIPGTTIYTTTGNRPTIAGENADKTKNAVHRAFEPDILGFDSGTFFTLDIVQRTTAARDLSVVMLLRYE